MQNVCLPARSKDGFCLFLFVRGLMFESRSLLFDVAEDVCLPAGSKDGFCLFLLPLA